MMPMRKSFLPLLLTFVALCPCWGTAGAAPAVPAERPGREFWSFQPLRAPAPPDAAAGAAADAWVKTPIDAFVRTAQAKRGLSPAAPAAGQTLVRRAYVGLLGLPPTPAELDHALTDQTPDGYAKLVDRLLASPHYGERWGRHWLDVARYADSDGYEADADRPTAFKYRDFVVRAFNDDMPFDQFVRWQIAGDELAPGDEQARTATGFLAAASSLMSKNGTAREREERRYNEMDDMLSTTGSAVLGLTVGCARCHDHKFDPISQRDYYRMLSAFAGARRDPPPKSAPGNGQTPKFGPNDYAQPAEGVTEDAAEPVESYLLHRGDVEKKSERVTLGFLTPLTPAPDAGAATRWRQRPEGAKTSHQRAALARWITDVEHGGGALAARVIVNRVWQHHFGQGLVRTPSDFGTQGDRPSHPELLDHLASEIVRNGWRLKPLHRLIMTSSVYQQGVTYDPAKAAIDPDNRLLWRRRPLRAEAEVLRDAILATSGQLDRDLYGPAVKPALPPEAAAGRNKDGLARPKQDGPDQWRRTVYLFTKRSLLTPMLVTFDAPNPIESCSRRSTSTVPTQALALLNDPFVRRQAELFAKRCLAEAPRQPAAQVTHAYRVALSRPPTEAELARGTAFVGDGVADEKLVDFCHVLFGVNEFVYID